MDQRYEDIIDDLKQKAHDIYNDENGIKELIERARKTILESDITKNFSEDVKISVDLLMDWKDKKYDNISKESMISIIVCLLFIVDPFDMLPDGLKTISKLLILAYLFKVIKDELSKYKDWKYDGLQIESNIHESSSGSFIELPINIEE